MVLFKFVFVVVMLDFNTEPGSRDVPRWTSPRPNWDLDRGLHRVWGPARISTISHGYPRFNRRFNRRFNQRFLTPSFKNWRNVVDIINLPAAFGRCRARPRCEKCVSNVVFLVIAGFPSAILTVACDWGPKTREKVKSKRFYMYMIEHVELFLN